MSYKVRTVAEDKIKAVEEYLSDGIPRSVASGSINYKMRANIAQ